MRSAPTPPAIGPSCATRAARPRRRRRSSAPGSGRTGWRSRCGAPADPRIVPFRGGYLRLRPPQAELVRANVYPVPDPELPFLGAHLTRTLGDEVLIGPSALMVAASDAYRLGKVRPRDLAETIALARDLEDGGPPLAGGRCWRSATRPAAAPSSPRRRASFRACAEPRSTPGRAGIRAQALGRDGRLVDDFVIHRTERAIHVRNAPSPAATSSLALAELIADELPE